jgi:hypothetical protein
MFEAEMKANIFKIANLEHQLMAEKNEKLNLENQIKDLKDKQINENRVISQTSMLGNNNNF